MQKGQFISFAASLKTKGKNVPKLVLLNLSPDFVQLVTVYRPCLLQRIDDGDR